MIRFNGNYSDKLLEKNDIKNMKTGIFLCFFIIVLAIVFIVTGWVLKEDKLFWIMCVCLATGIVLVIFFILRLLYILKHLPKPYLDLQINDEKILFSDGSSSKEMCVSDVVKVKDLGHEYHLCFSKNSAMKLCICEKDLLVEGDLSEFEYIFRDKLKKQKFNLR